MCSKQFVIKTDYHSLRYIFTQRNFTGRIFKWMERLQQYDFEVEHIPGWKNLVADALSTRDEEDNERPTKKLKTKQECSGIMHLKDADALRNQIRYGYSRDELYKEMRALLSQEGDEMVATKFKRNFKMKDDLMYTKKNEEDQSDW